MNNLSNEIKKISKFSKSLELDRKGIIIHNLRIGGSILFLFTINFLLSFFIQAFNFWIAIAAILLSGFCIYYYFILVVHEGSHDILFITKNNWIKRIIPSFSMIAGFPSYTVYLRDHITHHNKLLEKEDLQNTMDLNFRKIPLFYFTRKRPIYPFKHFLSMTNIPIYLLALSFKLTHIYAIFLFTGLKGIFLGIIVPLMIAATLNAFRVSFRHYKLMPNPKPLRSRSYTFFGSSIFGPGGLKYHFEHHLFKTIPSYQLKKIYNFVEKNCSKELIKKVHYKTFHWKDFW